MNTKFIIIIISILVSCKSNLTEKHYKSTDEITGGFNNFSLDLFPSGTLRLTIETSFVIEENDTGIIWETKPKTVTGNWYLKDQKIIFSFDEPNTSIDSIFINTDFIDFINNPILEFSQEFDTAYIYGIPCLLIENQNNIEN